MSSRWLDDQFVTSHNRGGQQDNLIDDSGTNMSKVRW